MPYNILIALVLTIAIEIAVAFLFGYRDKDSIFSVGLVNLITNPILNYFLWLNSFFSFIQANLIIVMILEMAAILIEWLLLIFALRQKPKKLLALSIVMNLCSFAVGIVMFGLLYI